MRKIKITCLIQSNFKVPVNKTSVKTTTDDLLVSVVANNLLCECAKDWVETRKKNRKHRRQMELVIPTVCFRRVTTFKVSKSDSNTNEIIMRTLEAVF